MNATAGKKLASNVQALERALQILNAIAEARYLSVSEISERVGLPISTTYRLVDTLRAHGYIYQGPRSKRYRIGFAAFTVGSAYLEGGPIGEVALPLMKEAVHELGETLCLAIQDGQHAVYIRCVEGRHLLRLSVREGTRVPLHCTAAGKIFLALGPPSIRDTLDETHLQPCTDRTITALEKLQSELDAVSQQGFATDYEEFEGGVASVAVPVLNRFRDAGAAIVLSAPRGRLTETELQSKVVPRLKMMSRAISQKLAVSVEASPAPG